MHCEYSLEASHCDTSNEYIRIVFLWRNKKTVPLELCLGLKLYLTLSTLGNIFSRQHTEFFFLFLLEKKFLCFMQIFSIGDNLHEMSNPVFWEK